MIRASDSQVELYPGKPRITKGRSFRKEAKPPLRNLFYPSKMNALDFRTSASHTFKMTLTCDNIYLTFCDFSVDRIIEFPFTPFPNPRFRNRPNYTSPPALQ